MNARGFTLIELVVAIAISAIVVVFAAMFIGAPLGAYEAHSRRAVLVANASFAWPRMEADLRQALPDSLRERRNGNFVVLEMFKVLDVTRYMEPPSGSFKSAGLYRAVGIQPHYLSVNNVDGTAYTLTGSVVPIATFQNLATATPGEEQITVTPAPSFPADSPKHKIYFVEGPVTYLCDESAGAGTLTRYANYTVAALQTSLDSPAELAAAGGTSELIAQGLAGCNFSVSAFSATQSQTAAVRLTTTRNGDSVTLLHSVHAEYVP